MQELWTKIKQYATIENLLWVAALFRALSNIVEYAKQEFQGLGPVDRGVTDGKISLSSDFKVTKRGEEESVFSGSGVGSE